MAWPESSPGCSTENAAVRCRNSGALGCPTWGALHGVPYMGCPTWGALPPRARCPRSLELDPGLRREDFGGHRLQRAACRRVGQPFGIERHVHRQDARGVVAGFDTERV